MVRLLPMPAWPTRNIYRFGNNGEVVLSHTRCSSTDAIVAIAAQRRKIGALSTLAVYSTNRSIQDMHLLRPLAGVPAFPGFEAIGICFLVVFAPVETYLGVVWDG